MGSALGAVGTRTILDPQCGTTVIQCVTPATVIGGTDNLTVDLSKFGCTNIHGILGFVENTTGEVVVQEQPTTSVSSSTLTITVGGSGTKRRTYIIFAY